MTTTHRHECTTCGSKYECPGHFEANHDGWPPIICTAVNVEGVTECADCWRKPACLNCGAKPDVLHGLGFDSYCADCFEEAAAADEQTLDYFNRYIAGDR